jgi:hypothetical protein
VTDPNSRKPRFGRKGCPRIDDPNTEPGQRGHRREGLGDMHRADDGKVERSIENRQKPALPADLCWSALVCSRGTRSGFAKRRNVRRRINQSIFAGGEVRGAYDCLPCAARIVDG